MLLVGGGMFVHNINEIHDLFHALPVVITELLVGLIVGFFAYLIIEIFNKVRSKNTK
jgi:flagellar biosynthesis protein FliR